MKTITKNSLGEEWEFKNSGTSKTYKSINIPPDLHHKIKTSALKKKQTIISFLKEIINSKDK